MGGWRCTNIYYTGVAQPQPPLLVERAGREFILLRLFFALRFFGGWGLKGVGGLSILGFGGGGFVRLERLGLRMEGGVIVCELPGR